MKDLFEEQKEQNCVEDKIFIIQFVLYKRLLITMMKLMREFISASRKGKPK